MADFIELEGSLTSDDLARFTATEAANYEALSTMISTSSGSAAGCVFDVKDIWNRPGVRPIVTRIQREEGITYALHVPPSGEIKHKVFFIDPKSDNFNLRLAGTEKETADFIRETLAIIEKFVSLDQPIEMNDVVIGKFAVRVGNDVAGGDSVLVANFNKHMGAVKEAMLETKARLSETPNIS